MEIGNVTLTINNGQQKNRYNERKNLNPHLGTIPTF